MGRGAGRIIQIGAPTLHDATETYLARTKLRSNTHKAGLRQQCEKHYRDWMKLPLDEITRGMVVRRHQELAATPSTASHLLKYFRTVWNHAKRIHDLPECPTMAIEWFEEWLNGAVIENLRQ